MKRRKIIIIILDILIIVFLLGVILSLFGVINGSLEMMPTEEQQEKTRIGAVLSMILFFIPCITCIVFRIKSGKK